MIINNLNKYFLFKFCSFFELKYLEYKIYLMLSKSKKYSVSILFESYDHSSLDLNVSKLVFAIKKTNLSISGPIPIPTKSVRLAVRRAPNIYKNSMEKYIRKVHRRKIIINTSNPNNDLMFLGNMSLPNTISIRINTNEST